MFTKAIKEVKKAIKEGKFVHKQQTATPGKEFADAIYIDGKLAVIVSELLLPYWKMEAKKAKLDTQAIVSFGTVLI